MIPGEPEIVRGKISNGAPISARRSTFADRAQGSGQSHAMDHGDGHVPRRPTVLVVDDDQAIRNSLTFSLEIEGFAVRAFASGDELLKEREFPERGCLVIDYHLPGINGLELLGKLRARNCLLPAILATTHVDANLRLRIAAAGMVLVEKPFIGNALADAIGEALGR